MPRGRFLNQKLGKRTSRKLGLLKSQLAAQRQHALHESGRARKKGVSREPQPKAQKQPADSALS